jgi:UDP-N-acetylmuramate--alanine ligase
MALPSPDDLPALVRELARPGDLVVCLGAGTVTNWAHALPGELELLDAGELATGEAGE